MADVLVVDDEPGLRSLLEVVMRRDDHQVRIAATGAEALESITEHGAPDVLLTDLRMDGMTGLELLEKTRQIDPNCFVVVMTAFADWQTAMRAMRIGAYNFLAKPFDNDIARNMVRRAIAARDHFIAAHEEGNPRHSVHLVGTSAAIHDLQQLIEQVSTTDATVLIHGESGTGKELVASAIHYGSLRSDRSMVRINSGALTPSLLESELFGHVQGAFTGAIDDRQGLFALADGGTLFLDEVGDLALETQVKLLRVLENGEYMPVGGTEVQTCDVRVIAASNKNLQAMVDAGTFREDLFYRLAVIRINIPALRDRREDLPLLAGHLLSRHAVRLRRGVDGFTDEALDAMANYRWPGNIRELDNRIQRGVALTSDGDIEVHAVFGDVGETATAMWRHIRGEPTGAVPRESREPGSGALERRRSTAEVSSDDPIHRLQNNEHVDLEDILQRRERELIEAALAATDDSLTEAAKRLGITFRQIRYKAKQLGIR